MTTSMREALERLDDAARGFGWNSDQYRARWKEVQAAISSHTLDRLSDEERRVIDGARSGGMANVGYRGLQTLLAIIDRLSRRTEPQQPVADTAPADAHRQK